MAVQNTPENPAFAPDFAPDFAQQTRQLQAEAAQYALLRRIAPAIRHDMSGSIQPVAMSAALLKRRLQKPGIDPLVLEKTASDIANLARQAAAAAAQSMAWFAPSPGASVSLGQGIEECLHLLRTPLSFQGFEIHQPALEGLGDVWVARSCLCNAFIATLLAMTDSAAAKSLGGVVRLALQRTEESTVQLELTLENTQAAPADTAPLPYRALRASDAQAIASAEGVVLQWRPEQSALSHATLAFTALAQPESAA